MRVVAIIGFALALAACTPSEPSAPPAPAAPVASTAAAPAPAAPHTVSIESGTATTFTALALPATFQGVLPCADCAGIEHTLTLRADGSYWYGLRYLGQPERDASALRDIGRWAVVGAPERLELRNGRVPLVSWALTDANTLRKFDIEGRPIVSDLPYEIRRMPSAQETFGEVRMRGMFRYMADAALFESCETGTKFAVAGGPGYLELERAYLAAGKPQGAPRLAIITGTLGPKPTNQEGWPVWIAVTQVERVLESAACPEAAP